MIFNGGPAFPLRIDNHPCLLGQCDHALKRGHECDARLREISGLSKREYYAFGVLKVILSQGDEHLDIQAAIEHSFVVADKFLIEAEED